MRSEEKKRLVTVYTSVIICIGQYDQNDRNAIKRCAPPGPQKHITKKSEGLPAFHSTLDYDTSAETS